MQIQLIEKYRSTKNEFEDAKKWVDQYQAELEKTEAYRFLKRAKAELEIAKSELKEADEHLRWVALDDYKKTSDKNPCPGIKIVINTKLHYTLNFAISWALQYAPNMITLKKSSFEKEVRQLLGTSQQLNFVETTKEPSVQIGKGL